MQVSRLVSKLFFGSRALLGPLPSKIILLPTSKVSQLSQKAGLFTYKAYSSRKSKCMGGGYKRSKQATNWFGADLARTRYFADEMLLTYFWFPDTRRCKDIFVSLFQTAAKILYYIVLLARKNSVSYIRRILHSNNPNFYKHTAVSASYAIFQLFFLRSKALAFWHRKTFLSAPQVFLLATTDRKRSPCASCSDHMHPRNIVARSDGGKRRGNQELLLGQFTWSPHEREVANQGQVRQYETASLL